jgi:hypothetical protein
LKYFPINLSIFQIEVFISPGPLFMLPDPNIVDLKGQLVNVRNKVGEVPMGTSSIVNV